VHLCCFPACWGHLIARQRVRKCGETDIFRSGNVRFGAEIVGFSRPDTPPIEGYITGSGRGVSWRQRRPPSIAGRKFPGACRREIEGCCSWMKVVTCKFSQTSVMEAELLVWNVNGRILGRCSCRGWWFGMDQKNEDDASSRKMRGTS
jgi:hypothetical protein